MGSITILLDCGIDEAFTQSHLNDISSALRTFKVDYVLISHSSLTQIGALPYLQGQGMLEGVKVMSTSPTAKMASLTLYEYFIQRKELADFKLFTL